MSIILTKSEERKSISSLVNIALIDQNPISIPISILIRA